MFRFRLTNMWRWSRLVTIIAIGLPVVLACVTRPVGVPERGPTQQRGLAFPQSVEKDIDLLALEEALSHLGSINERAARVVELRYFGGLSNQDIAEDLDVSVRTVISDWTFARAWLLRALED